MKISTLITASENSFANSDPLSVRTNAMGKGKTHLKTELKEFLVACEAWDLALQANVKRV